jgi:hypothetical protein
MKYPSHIILDMASHITTATHSKVETKGTTGPQYISNKDNFKTATPFTLFDVHFVRKERLYTKLKYSRCPQYDIVSGGFAALLAGFIGFLISEKFGIELVDSGDFYIAFMYVVFTVFSLRPLIVSYSKHETPYNPISLKYLIGFLFDLATLLLRASHSAFINAKRFFNR